MTKPFLSTKNEKNLQNKLQIKLINTETLIKTTITDLQNIPIKNQIELIQAPKTLTYFYHGFYIPNLKLMTKLKILSHLKRNG